MFALASSSLAVAVALASHCPAAPSPIALAFVSGGMTHLASDAVEEAARVWARYGVAIETVGGTRVHGVLVHVRLAVSPPGTSDRRALGTIEFHDGVPDPVVTLYPQRAWALIAQAAGAASGGWPISYRDQMLGRVLGRALAHEIGHFLLQMPAHSGNGLMRAVQPIALLMEGDRSAFTLSAGEIAVLQRRNNCAPPDIVDGKAHSQEIAVRHLS